MTEGHGLRWEPWPAEAGAWIARGAWGQSFVARPNRGGFALFRGGQHIQDCADAAEFRRVAAEIETMDSKVKGSTQ